MLRMTMNIKSIVMILSIAAVGLLTARCSSDIPAVVSPNGIVGFVGTDSSNYFVTYKGQNVLEITNLGFTGENKLTDFKLVGTVHDEYDMLSGKKLHQHGMQRAPCLEVPGEAGERVFRQVGTGAVV